ncbi:MAG: hypothetical protein GY916_01560 [Gammaproteobacteria bacterium]|nr:hypothetical protein [Gammaproteobacteria bacterium]
MSPLPDMNYLSLDQAPPLEIPAAFFLTAPFAVMAAGGLLLWTDATALQSNWQPLVLGLTHLGTLGFLTMVMMGALYQMSPVVAGAPIPLIRLAHLVQILLCAGVSRLVLDLSGLWSGFTFGSFVLIALAVLLFLATVGFAVSTTNTRGETVSGMRLALFCLLVMMLLGLIMARGFFDGVFPGARGFWVQIHLSTALLGWVGGLIAAVSWQVVPMFYLTTPINPFKKKAVMGMTVLGIILPLGILLLQQTGPASTGGWVAANAAALGTLPAVLGVWLLHPVFILQNFQQRRRKHLDASLLFWQAGLCIAPVTAICAGFAYFSHDPRWVLLFGWLAIWGWAGMIVHGMLSRIIPFLVWFHRFAPYIGRIPVPAMRKMLPDVRTKLGLGCHLISLLLGILAIATRDPWIARATGLLLLATGINLLHWMIQLFRQRPDLSSSNTEASTER